MSDDLLHGGLDDCYLIRNDRAKTCKTCGQVHDFISVRGKDGSCDTPAVFSESFAAHSKPGPGSWGVAVPLVPAA